MVYTRLIFFLFAWLTWQTAQAQNYFLNGDASFSGGNCYTITSAINWQNGTVWYANQLDLSQPFDIEFSMNFGTNDGSGADGMVFVLQTVGTSAIGASGGGMGFEGFNPSFGIEFDTFENSANNGSPAVADISADHMAFLRNGNIEHTSTNNLAGPVQASATSANIEDGQQHTVRITWNPANQFLHAYFDCSLRLFDTVDLVNSIFSGQNLVYFGFTGSTGGLNNNQSVCLSNQILGINNPDPICVGQSVNLEASGNPLGTYTWSPAAGLSSTNSASVQASPTVTTTYTVTYTSLCGIPIAEEVEVVVLPAYPLSVVTPQEFCEGEALTLTGVTLPEPYTLLNWTSTDGTFVSGTNSPSPTVGEAGSYMLSVSSANFCSASAVITVSTLPVPQINAGTDVQACLNETVVLTATTNGSNITWTPGGLLSPTLDVTAPGTYTATAALGACTASDDVVVSYITLPAFNLPDSLRACSSEGAVLNAGTEGVWSTGEVAEEVTVFAEGYVFFTLEEQNCTASDSTWITLDEEPVFELGPSAVLCPEDTLEWNTPFPVLWPDGSLATSFRQWTAGNVVATATNGACSFSDQLQVEARPFPTVDLPDSIVFCTGAVAVIGADALSDLTYTWNTGESTNRIEPVEEGMYVVTASNVCGTDSDSIRVDFQFCEHQIFIPNAFTPNADGVNDVWMPSYVDLAEVQTTVLDRWGTIVFESTDLNPVWTGNRRGQEHFVQDGVYVYRVSYTTQFNEAGEEYGTITLLR